MIDFGKVPGMRQGAPMGQGSYGQGMVGQGRPQAGQRTASPTVGQQGTMRMDERQGSFTPPPAGYMQAQPQGQTQAQPQAAQQNLGAPGPQAQAQPQQVSAQPAGGPGYNLGFNVPQQFGQAGQVYGQMAQGQFTIPQQIQQASQYANQMAGSGMPGSTQAYQQAAMPVIQKQMEDIRKNAMASANVSGMGNSSVLGQQIGQQQGDLMNQFNMNLAGQQMGLDESAKQRMLSGMGMLGQLGGQELQADQFGQNMAMQGAQGLQGLGQQYWNMPFQTAQAMSGLGQQYNQSLTTPLDQQYGQMLGLGAQGSGQNQFTQSFGGQVAQGLGAAAQYAPAMANYLQGNQGGGQPGQAQYINQENMYRSSNPYMTGFSLSPYTSGQLNLNPGQIQPYNLGIR